MQPLRVILVDDHRIVREGLSSMLRTRAELRIVGEAGTGREAIDLIVQLQPDIVLLDLEMPDLDGIQVLDQMRQLAPNVRTIVLTAYGSDERILEAVRMGAKGYLLKDAGLQEVIRAVNIVAKGGSLLEPMVAERLLHSVGHLLRGETVDHRLTERERDILRLIAQGLSNKTIGERLHLAERTVKFHLSIIFQKLAVNNRAEAVARALQEHLITP